MRRQLFFILNICIYFLFVFKLFDLQVLGNTSLNISEDKYLQTTNVPSKRGKIYARDGFPLAFNSPNYIISFDPEAYHLNKITYENNVLNKDVSLKIPKRDVTDIDEDNFKKISEIIGTNNKEKTEIVQFLRKIFNNKQLKYQIIAKDVSYDQKLALEQDKALWFLNFEKTYKREYSEDKTFSHLLGFLGKTDSGENTGYFGLEGYYNSDLKGVDGYIKNQKSASGAPIIIGKNEIIKTIDGVNIVTTIDRTMQYIAYNTLKERQEEYGYKSASLIALKPNGEVLSLVSYPSYDNVNFNKYFEKEESKQIFNDLNVSTPYEPGSVIKPFTISAALDTGKITTGSYFDDNGPVVYSGFTVDNWNGKHHGSVNAQRILELSNNVGTSKVGMLVGADVLFEYFKKFNLSEKTGIDLEGEQAGVFRDPSTWQNIDIASTSFGQSFSATPLQIAVGYTAFINEGNIYKPFVVKEVVEKGIINKPILLRKVIKTNVANKMVNLLEKAAMGGEAKYFVNKNYRIAGKTGTAQINEEGVYIQDTNSTFVGFLSNSKKFVLLLKLEKPQKSTYASETAVPIWMEIAAEYADYLKIPPDLF